MSPQIGHVPGRQRVGSCRQAKDPTRQAGVLIPYPALPGPSCTLPHP